MLDRACGATISLDSAATIVFQIFSTSRRAEAVRPYLIRQGDYLTRLAQRMGFRAEDVWNHPKNKELKARRRNPEILQPGDVLYVPDESDVPPRPITAGALNRFKAKVPTVQVKIKLETRVGEPIANKAFRVECIRRASLDGVTDASGLARFEVPIHVPDVLLTIEEVGLRYTVRIGHMDPVEEMSGVAKRLVQLGYLSREFAVDGNVDMVALSAAVADFQRAEGLAATGELNDAVRDAIVRSHGA
ncbi:peptidoglycan-binding domain-containing protein [Sorangium sp. So ce260]|uniref:peptidoglycan-binding domain-containing protein n=1 Tax=Sorangium sp. So ce260 TaxID=3133291 RepID=UPI003F61E5A0